jgi:hypothetical protein
MTTYYFDLKDGIPVRDRQGLDFSLTSEAIEHAKSLAGRIRQGSPKDEALTIVVVDESGQEVHREQVYTDS